MDGHLAPVLAPGHTFASITDKITSVVLTKQTSLGWFLTLAPAIAVAGMLIFPAGVMWFLKDFFPWRGRTVKKQRLPGRHGRAHGCPCGKQGDACERRSEEYGHGSVATG